jgi:hypothetical protein
VGTLSGLTVTAPITGSITGLAATATALQNPRTINGVSFNGTSDITVTTAANTLSGSTLASGVLASSLTSVGTLSGLTVTGTANLPDLVVGGNLTVSGTTTTINANTLNVADINITIANNATTAASANGAGLTVAGSAAATLLYASANDSWNFNKLLSAVSFTGAGTGLTGTAAALNIGGSSATATALQTARAINGVNFDGTAPVTITAAANTLTGTSLASGVLASSLTSVGTLSGLTVTAPITGSVTGNAGSATVAATANALGTANSYTVAGLSTPSITHTGTSGVGDIGSSAQAFGTVYAVATSAKYADLAENYQADAAYTPGTVVEFGGLEEITVGTADTTRVAGVVSTNPAHLMNGQLFGRNVVALALQGRVPCKVIGPVNKGDLMVSAGSGFAKTNNSAGVGQVIGKALNDYVGSKGVIEVVVGRF